MKLISHFFAGNALMATLGHASHAQNAPLSQKPLQETLQELSTVPLKQTVANGQISFDSEFDFLGKTPDRAVNVVVQDVNNDGIVGPGDFIVNAEIYNNGRLASLQRQPDGTYKTIVHIENFKTLKSSDKTVKAFNDAKITDSSEALTRAKVFVYKKL